MVVVIIPILNPDGHEQRSKYSRMNQNGPEENGWRANSRNQNLNRDYMKLDSPELRAEMNVFHQWTPDFFVDDHVSDGADFRYDTMFDIIANETMNAEQVKWITDTVTPDVVQKVNQSGHLTSPYYIALKDELDPAKGILQRGVASARYSTGYSALENRPSMLVEMHSLKDYKTRVTGNFECLKAVLEIVNRDADKLIELNEKADTEATTLGSFGKSKPPKRFPLNFETGKRTSSYGFQGYRFDIKHSDISGQNWVI